MTKLKVIGDLHGRDSWKGQVSEQDDVIVFSGDYVDSRDPNITSAMILRNLEDVLSFKRDNPEKVILLLGNHDNQYLFWHTRLQNMTRCTGYRSSMAYELNRLYNNNRSLFDVAYMLNGNILLTHAGVSNTFAKKYLSVPTEQYAEELTRLFGASPEKLLGVGPARSMGADAEPGGPFWVDAGELCVDLVPGLIQIVGHTVVKQIGYCNNNKGKCYFVDTENKESFGADIGQNPQSEKGITAQEQ